MEQTRELAGLSKKGTERQQLDTNTKNTLIFVKNSSYQLLNLFWEMKNFLVYFLSLHYTLQLLLVIMDYCRRNRIRNKHKRNLRFCHQVFILTSIPSTLQIDKDKCWGHWLVFFKQSGCCLWKCHRILERSDSL